MHDVLFLVASAVALNSAGFNLARIIGPAIAGVVVLTYEERPEHAVAMFRLGVCQEKVGEGEEARKAYQSYLKILPQGPFAAEARQGLARLKSLDPGAAAEKKNEPH